jgi:hypothetical protein
MLKSRIFLGWSIVALCAAGIAWVGSVSPSCEKCKADNAYDGKTNETEKSHPIMPRGFGPNARLFTRCEGTFLDENGVLITAIATIVIAGFTGTLWLSTTQQERISRTHERAYVLYGGLYGKPIHPKKFAASKQADDGAWRDASEYNDPWVMQIHNFGRTPGFITKVTWGECAEKDFIKEKPISEIIRRELLPIEKPLIVETVVNLTTANHPVPYRHVRHSRFVGQVFFGRIDYEDVFREKHRSTWAVIHRENSSDPIGKFMATDWS